MASFLGNSKSYQDILQVPPMDLFAWIENAYMSPIPESIETPDALMSAGNRLGELTNIYSYLMSMVTLLNMVLRNMKRSKETKAETDEMVSRRDVFQNAADIIKMQYTAISRMITVKKQADDEIRMLK